MTLEQMVYFQMIAKTKSLNKASEVLHISQPALTKQIKLLEHELNVQLLTRNNRGVSLTTEGEVFLEEIGVILNRVNTLKHKLNNLRTKSLYLRIGSLPSIAARFLPTLIQKIQSEGVRCEIQIIDYSSEIKFLLGEGKIDIGFVQDVSDEENTVFPLFLEPYHLVLPQSHFLARRASIDLKQLQEVTMILPKYPCDIRIAIDQYLNYQRIKLNHIIEINQNDSVLSLVQNGLGLTIMPEMIVSTLDSNYFISVPLADEGLHRKISFITYSCDIKELILSSSQTMKPKLSSRNRNDI